MELVPESYIRASRTLAHLNTGSLSSSCARSCTLYLRWLAAWGSASLSKFGGSCNGASAGIGYRIDEARQYFSSIACLSDLSS